MNSGEWKIEIMGTAKASSKVGAEAGRSHETGNTWTLYSFQITDIFTELNDTLIL